MNDIVDRVLDCVWPSARGSAGSSQRVPERVFPADTAADGVAAVLAMVEAQEKDEEERRKAVDQKLQAVLQFAAIAVTILLGLTTFLASARQQELGRVPLTTIVCVAGYVALQCFRAAMAAVEGLGRRGFSRPSLTDIAWRGDPNTVTYQHRLARQRLCFVAENAEVINTKVTCMSVAHTAVRNALAVLLLGVVVLVFTILAGMWIGKLVLLVPGPAEGEVCVWRERYARAEPESRSASAGAIPLDGAGRIRDGVPSVASREAGVTSAEAV